jgi:hypothetical protein
MVKLAVFSPPETGLNRIIRPDSPPAAISSAGKDTIEKFPLSVPVPGERSRVPDLIWRLLLPLFLIFMRYSALPPTETWVKSIIEPSMRDVDSSSDSVKTGEKTSILLSSTSFKRALSQDIKVNNKKTGRRINLHFFITKTMDINLTKVV